MADPCKIDPMATGCFDEDMNELFLGDKVTLHGVPGDIRFEAGAFGISTAHDVPWDRIRASYPGRVDACLNDHFVSLWELIWNSEVPSEECLCVGVKRA